MAVAPISCLVYKIPRTVLDENAKSMVGIDRGCSLTKAAYVPKNGEGNTATHYAVHCVLFNNSDFEGCLHFLKENALLPATGIIRVTGAGCDKNRDVIKNIIGVEVEFMDEFVTVIRGSHFLLTHAEDRDSLFFPTPPVDTSLKVEHTPEMKERWAKAAEQFAEKAKSEDPNDIFPCIFVSFGSAAASMLIEKDGSAKLVGMAMMAGKSLMGLGRALTGTSNYDELMELAANGCCGNVDNTVAEFIRDDPKSPYGRFPKHLPLFPFGKFVDQESKLEDYRREDLAAAVVRMVAMELCSIFISGMMREQVTRVIIGGHGILGEPVRKDIMEHLKVFMNFGFEPKCMKTGATGAIGAMIATVEDFKKIKPTG